MLEKVKDYFCGIFWAIVDIVWWAICFVFAMLLQVYNFVKAIAWFIARIVGLWGVMHRFDALETKLLKIALTWCAKVLGVTTEEFDAMKVDD